MSEAEIRDELLTLLVAGHETTATSLSWAVERLVRHPEKLERLRAEVEAGEERLPDRDDPGDPAPAPGDRARRPAPHRAGRDRRLRAARRRHRHALHPPDPPRPEIYPGAGALPARSASSRPRPAPTPGSPSAAACAAASAPPSPSSRWRSSSASWSGATRIRPARPESERPFRRAITETPRHDAEVVLGARACGAHSPSNRSADRPGSGTRTPCALKPALHRLGLLDQRFDVAQLPTASS